MRSWSFGVLSWLLLNLAQVFAGQMVYDITPLDPSIFGDYNGSRATAINNQRLVIGTAAKYTWMGEFWSEDVRYTAVWDFSQINSNGISHLLPNEVPAQTFSYPTLLDLNDRGQACGYYHYDGLPRTMSADRPLLYNVSSRSLTLLKSLGDDEKGDPFLDDYSECYEGVAISINTNSVIAGTSHTNAVNMWGLTERSLNQVPCRWTGGTEPEGLQWSGKINNLGVMISTSISDPEHAYVTTGASASPLSNPSDRAGWRAVPTDINDRGWVVGSLMNASSGVDEPALWHPELGFVRLPLYPGTQSAVVRAINNQGTMVGTSDIGAVIWIGSGTNYQIVSLDMYADQTGWYLSDAIDINDDGWILGQGRYNGLETGFIARTRLDQDPPTAALKPNTGTWSKGRLSFTVFYYDDMGLNTNSLGNTDINVQFPDGTQKQAQLDKCREIAADAGSDKRKYEVQYSVAQSGLNPFDSGSAVGRILVNGSEVADMGDLYVASGKLGEIPLGAAVSIVKGFLAGTNNQPLSWTFETRLFLGTADQFTPIVAVRFQPPGSSQWYAMETANRQVWQFSTNSAAAPTGFGVGNYLYSVTVTDGGPQEFTMTYRYGYAANGQLLPAPTEAPRVTSPGNGTQLPLNEITLAWIAPADPAITRIICSVQDRQSGEVVMTVNTTNTTTGFSPQGLLANRDYRTTIYFCTGDSDLTEQNQWASYKLLYSASSIDFHTLPSSTPDAVVILSMTRTPDQIEVEFSSVHPNNHLEMTTSLSSQPWSDLTAAVITPSTNNLFKARCPAPNAGAAFFRIRSTP